MKLIDSIPTAAADSRRHLLATSVVLPSHGICISTRLRRAVFWVHLRQEIYIACVEQSTVQANLENCTSESSLESLDDDAEWVHRALWICAQVLQWAFGSESTHGRWLELCKLVFDWEKRRPNGFDPVFFRPRDPVKGRWFPEICHVTDEHGASRMSYARNRRFRLTIPGQSSEHISSH